MGKIEEVIPDEEIERLAQQSGIYERLPADFVPFKPGVEQRQTAQAHAWANYSDSEEDEPDDDSDSGDDGEDDYGADEYSVQGTSAQQVMEDANRDGMNPQVEEAFDVIIWTMPFGFLFLLLDIMIQQQYAQHPSFLGEMTKMLANVPILGTFVYITMPKKGKDQPLLQAGLFLVGILSGCSFLWVMAKSDWEVVMRRTPPLGTVWVYSIVRLHLFPACVSLAIVAAFVRFADLNLRIFNM
ncbi:hypothetical protein K437DRAFT_271924 [Tilletiaria anomala UBC 951]|uniref:DUF7719 domain-containing protein n=1 Tax=Tilletiaria anomala (strain ATCC 24038 / CBS 436.72 / UBC 951) TaxID=1037660 RepID=A0A066WH36_TILAU|nr:uncharacterized protein K437DRAFT_271924 [Tilletiaria anomala UBC 951]KDN53141.1 hypothetical protein K437DRAFT_271924 [Tilletiaria anomala UBC 951]